jgi:branched-chain amino acid transport system permease protein
MMPTQILANVLISAAGYLLIGLSFGLIYRVARFFHFSHGAIFTLGAYATLSLSGFLPWWFAFPAATLFSAIIGWLLFRLAYLPLQVKGSSAAILLIASLGLFIVLQNVVSMIYGDEMHSLLNGPVGEGFLFLNARITTVQLFSVTCSVVLCVVMWLLLRFTRVGLVLRAVANDRDLSYIFGIEPNKVVGQSFLIGSALAGAAGALLALDTHLTPTMGFRALLMAVVMVVIGGLGSMPGIGLAALLVALAQHVGAWYFSAKWQDATAFVALLVFLVARPHGFFGSSVRKAKV